MNAMYYRHKPMFHHPMFPYLHGMVPERSVLEEEEIATVSLQIERKRFYVDVKKNARGVFMKIAQVEVDGTKHRIILTIPAALEIKEKFKDLIDVMEETQKQTENKPIDTDKDDQKADNKTFDSEKKFMLIKSHIVNCAYRRYFLDLKRNQKGLYLRFTMLSSVNRIHLTIPAQGMTDLYVTISDLLAKCAGECVVTETPGQVLPESKSMRVDNRTLYFDTSHNRYGAYLRISEVRPSSRTAITIPGHSISRFRDIINSLAKDLTSMKVTSAVENSDTVEDKIQDEEPSQSNDSS